MRKLFLFLMVALFFGSCDMYTKVDYTYKFKMVEPVSSDKLVYQDDIINIAFDITTKYIDVIIQNKLDDPIKIIWDNAAWIKDGKSQKVAHSGMYIKNVYKESTPPTAITGQTTIKESIAPADGLKYDGFTKSYKWKHYYIDNKMIANQLKFDVKEYLGDKIKLLLPLEINGKEKNYTFTFVVSSVSGKKK